MKQFFLVIYSSSSAARKICSSNFFCSSHQLFDNCYVGELERDQIIECTELRTELMKIESSRMMVIRLDADFTSAWYLSDEANKYLTSIFKNIHNGK